MCDNEMKIDCNYGFQWVYYLQNIYDGDNSIPFELIGYILPFCNSNSKKCNAIGMIQYSYGYGSNRKSDKIINPISFEVDVSR